jgi:hypothetical protein
VTTTNGGSQGRTPDRLTEIEGKIEWLVAYYDLPDKSPDAEDDVRWLIAEVKRLREQRDDENHS